MYGQCQSLLASQFTYLKNLISGYLSQIICFLDIFFEKNEIKYKTELNTGNLFQSLMPKKAEDFGLPEGNSSQFNTPVQRHATCIRPIRVKCLYKNTSQ